MPHDGKLKEGWLAEDLMRARIRVETIIPKAMPDPIRAAEIRGLRKAAEICQAQAQECHNELKADPEAYYLNHAEQIFERSAFLIRAEAKKLEDGK